jgi:hypothetical protein
MTDESTSMQFTIDLGKARLTEEELSGLHHQITKSAVEAVRKSGVGGKGEPYVKILHVKSVPNPP